MDDKTIEIDAEAYARLEKARRAGESFSDTLKRVIWDPAPFNAMLEQIGRNPLSDEAIAAVEQAVAARHKPSRRARKSAGG